MPLKKIVNYCHVYILYVLFHISLIFYLVCIIVLFFLITLDKESSLSV